MTYTYQYETKHAYLSGDFGRDYACKVFGITIEQLEQMVGRYTRGKRVGQLRGYIVWGKVIRGGWVKTGRYDFDTNTPCGFVTKKNITFGHGLFDRNGKLVKGVDIQDSGDAVTRALEIANGRALGNLEKQPDASDADLAVTNYRWWKDNIDSFNDQEMATKLLANLRQKIIAKHSIDPET